jgi:ubiquinone/menaquinone biosynthesis C-methylase UbiE
MTQAKQDIIDREHKTWSSVAEGWKKHDVSLKQSGEPVTQRLIELAAIKTGDRILDIASGTGEPAIPMAQLVGETGFVVGTDLSDDMLIVARDKARQLNVTNIEFHRVDGETLAFEPESFDATTIRWGLMFMPEPENILSQIHGLLRNEGSIAVACWAEPERNPFFTHIMSILMKYMEVPQPSEGAPGVFAFADPDRLIQTLTQSGFRHVDIEDLEVTMFEADSGEEYWQMMEGIAGPITQLVQQMESQTRETFIRDVIDSVDAQKQGGKVRMRGTTWIAHGRK